MAHEARLPAGWEERRDRCSHRVVAFLSLQFENRHRSANRYVMFCERTWSACAAIVTVKSLAPTRTLHFGRRTSILPEQRFEEVSI